MGNFLCHLIKVQYNYNILSVEKRNLIKMNYLFEFNMRIAAEGGLYVLQPFLLPLRVFLSPNSIDVVWEQSGRLIRGVTQAAARHPGLQSTWRG